MFGRGAFAILMLWFAAPYVANATGTVALKSSVFVERVKTDRDGQPMTELRAAETVTPGDRLVFILTYRNDSDRAVPNVVITNPVPTPVYFDGAAAQDAEVSVDSGRSWGALNTLRILSPSGQSRAAIPPDVTHIRWKIDRALRPGGTGRLSFRGTVK
jgi:uncharacterized repeat protein (TIGR01451 family)